MNNINELLKLSNVFFKLAELDFLSNEEADDYFNEEYLYKLQNKYSESCDKLKYFFEIMQLLRDNISSYVYELNSGKYVEYSFEYVKNKENVIHNNKQDFDEMTYRIKDKIRNELSDSTDFFLKSTSAILGTRFDENNIVYSQFNDQDLKNCGDHILIIINEILSNIFIGTKIQKFEDTIDILSEIMNLLRYLCRFSKKLQKILHLFKIFSLDIYFKQIIPDLKNLHDHLNSYFKSKEKIKNEETSQKEFDEWAANSISETQLSGEYEKDDLAWEDLDEEDKLRLLERGNHSLYNKFYFSESNEENKNE